MRAWLINSAEPVPTDSGKVRLRRMGILANVLASRGHEVLWWTSTFHHVHKTQRFPKDTTVDLPEGYRLRFLHAPPYHRNISLSRWWNHRVLARKFRQQAGTEAKPDVILCSYPTLELSDEAVKYGSATGTPVALDIRDLWPDLFLDRAPRWTRPFVRLALHPLFRVSRRACAGAFAICANVPAFVEWGIQRGRRRRTGYDRDFPFGYVVQQLSETEMADAERFWRDKGVPAGPDATIVCFMGVLNHQFDIETVIRAARELQDSCNVQFVICGAGVQLDTFREMAADCPNVIFPGWVDAPEIHTLMRISRLGLAPYVDCPNYQDNITNKPIEYLAGGLPILTTLQQGTLADLLREHDCGMSYENDQQLADVIRSLQATPRRLQDMSRNASKVFAERFVADRVYNDMADHLEKIAAAKSSC